MNFVLLSYGLKNISNGIYTRFTRNASENSVDPDQTDLKAQIQTEQILQSLPRNKEQSKP